MFMASISQQAMIAALMDGGVPSGSYIGMYSTSSGSQNHAVSFGTDTMLDTGQYAQAGDLLIYVNSRASTSQDTHYASSPPNDGWIFKSGYNDLHDIGQHVQFLNDWDGTTINATGPTNSGWLWQVLVFRNLRYRGICNRVGGINGLIINPPPRLPIVPGSKVLAFGARAKDNGAITPPAISSFGDLTELGQGHVITSTGKRVISGIAIKDDWVSGSVDPTAWAVSGDNGADNSSSAATVVLEPPPVDPPTDPYWENVVFLLWGEGADGTQQFQDRSKYHHYIANVGGVEIDDGVTVGGSGSIQISSYSTYLISAYHSAMSLGTANGTPDFCFEAYINCSDVSQVNYLIGRRRDANNFTLHIQGGAIIFTTYSGTGGTVRLSVAAGIVNNTTYHVCVIRAGTTYYAFVDGVLVGSNNSPSGSIGADSTDLYIGQSDTNSARWFRGRINWLRMTIGFSRYNLSGFTPDPLPYGIAYSP